MISGPWRMRARGSATNTPPPGPGRASTRPRVSSSLTASLTVALATPKRWRRSSLVPSRSPVPRVPSEISSSSSRARASARDMREAIRALRSNGWLCICVAMAPRSLITVFGTDAFSISRQVQSEQLPASELVQQEVVGPQPRQPADVAGEERVQLLLRQRRHSGPQRRLRPVAEGLAQGGLVSHPVAELVDRIAAHLTSPPLLDPLVLAPDCEGVAELGLCLQQAGRSRVQHAEHGDPQQQLPAGVACLGELVGGGFAHQLLEAPLLQVVEDGLEPRWCGHPGVGVVADAGPADLQREAP